MLLVARPSPLFCHNPIPSGEALKIPLQSSWGETAVGAPKKWPTMLGELDVHLGPSFPTGETIVSEETSRCGAAPSWEKGNEISV